MEVPHSFGSNKAHVTAGVWWLAICPALPHGLATCHFGCSPFHVITQLIMMLNQPMQKKSVPPCQRRNR